MTISINNIDQSERKLYAKVDSTLTSQDIVDYFKAVDKALPAEASYTECIDFTDTDNFLASYDDRALFEDVARKVYEENKYTKVVCIVKTDQQYGSVRMYASLFRLTEILEIKKV